MDERKQGSFQESLAKLPAKTLFLGGIASGVLVLCTVGFFIMLGIFLGGNSGTLKTGGGAGVVAEPSDPTLPDDGNIELTVTDDDWYRGGKNAEVTIVEFSDLECPFCKTFHPTMQQVVDEYGDKVKWVYRHFPLTSIHSKAQKEAEAAECAGELGGNTGFWSYIDRVYEVTPSNNGLDLAKLPEIAQEIGLNKQKFETCLNSGKYAKKVQADAQSGVAAGARGTPYSVIIAGDQKIPLSGAMPFAQIKSAIDSLLQ